MQPSLKEDLAWDDEGIRDAFRPIDLARGLPVPEVKVWEQPKKQFGASCGYHAMATLMIANEFGWAVAMKLTFTQE